MQIILKKLLISSSSRSASKSLLSNSIRCVRRSARQIQPESASNKSDAPAIGIVEEKLDLKSEPNIPVSVRLALENEPHLATESLTIKRRLKFSFDSGKTLDRVEEESKTNQKAHKIVTLDTLELLEDASVPKSRVDCPGCGSRLHCQNRHVEGFLPADEFKSLSKSEMQYKLCYRCEILTTRKKILNVETNSSFDYDKFIVERIRNQSKAHVILLVDLLDIPNSIYDGWSKLFNNNTKKTDENSDEVNL